MADSETKGTRHWARDFWNRAAREDARFHILSSDEILDEATRDTVFEAAAQRDAEELAWYFGEGARVVDLGCGIGRVMRPLAKVAAEVIGYDISTEMIDRSVDYLSGVENAVVRETEGSSLPRLEDESVDFLYSILCLIHVDRRSATKYFREFRRVLRRGARAVFQVHDLCSTEGLERFLGSLDLEYPLEFYGPDAIRTLVESAGLAVLEMRPHGEFLTLTVTPGDTEECRRRWSESATCRDISRSGWFGGEGGGESLGGGLELTVESHADTPMVHRADLRVFRAGRAGAEAPLLDAAARIPLEPGRERRVRFEIEGRGATRRLALDGEILLENTAGDPLPSDVSEVDVYASITPGGFAWGEETRALFPRLCLHHRARTRT